MDSVSASQVARLLGTNVPRVLRSAERLGLRPRRVGTGTGTRVRFSNAQVERLRDALGVQGTSGLSRVQAQVLAALARSGRGALSARALARRAAVSPTACASALAELERRGLIIRERRRVTLGGVREVEVLRANPLADDWAGIGPELARVRPPRRQVKRVRRVPAELRHLFWNTADSQLDIEHAGGYIARRLIQVGNLDGLAWGAENLEPEHWRHAAATRGLSAPVRALALNLADQDRPQTLLVPPKLVEGFRIAGIPDLLAMKLKVIAQRGEHRDYFDLQMIEEKTAHTVDEGLTYFVTRYRPEDIEAQVGAIIRALGYMDDVDEDEALPLSKREVERYWRRRQPEILKSAGWLTSGGTPPAVG
jgi:DNA-binding Lrp family transcriptional regulator